MLSFLFSLLLPLTHAYHVAVCELNYDQKTSSLQFTHKIFTDDLEKAIETSTGKKLLLGNPKQHPEAKQLIGNYVVQHFLVKNNGKVVKTAYVGYEVDNDQLFVYFEAPLKSKPKKLDLIYNPLIEIYSDQSNIIHLSVSGQKKSLYFNSGQTSHSAQF